MNTSIEPTRRRRRGVYAVIGVLVVAAVAAGVLLFALRTQPGQPPPAAVVTQTVAVQRTDISDTQTYSGSLGYGSPQKIQGDGAGTVTQLPQVGDVAERGKALFRVDDHPVPVFFGTTPLFRTLDTAGTQGSDVAMVAANLSALGYYRGAVPKDPRHATLTEGMLAALKVWQRTAGLEPTGTLAVGQVLLLPGTSRVSSVVGKLGDPVAEDLLTVTLTTKLVTIPVQAGQVSALHTGVPATIVLPTESTVPGKVTAIDTLVQGDAPAGQAKGNEQTIQVTVTPDDQGAVGNLDTASVQVQITTEVHTGVLTVPIAALIALKEGGYAVQLENGQLVPVRTGMYGQQVVEVSGSSLTEGQRVVTTS